MRHETTTLLPIAALIGKLRPDIASDDIAKNLAKLYKLAVSLEKTNEGIVVARLRQHAVRVAKELGMQPTFNDCGIELWDGEDIVGRLPDYA